MSQEVEVEAPFTISASLRHSHSHIDSGTGSVQHQHQQGQGQGRRRRDVPPVRVVPPLQQVMGGGGGRSPADLIGRGLGLDLDLASQMTQQCPPGSVPVRKLVLRPARSESLLGRYEDAAARSLWADQSGRDIETIEKQFREEAEQRLLAVERQKELVRQQSNDEEAVLNKTHQGAGHHLDFELDGEGVGASERVGSRGGSRAASRKKSKHPDEASQNATKAKLMNLNKFVMAHTTRKVKGGWDFVDNKFQSSPSYESVMVKDSSGIASAVRVKTIPLSALTMVLCSMQVQLNQKQLIALYEGLDIDEARTIISCKIAARKLILSTSTNPDTHQLCSGEIKELAVDGDPMIRIDKFKDQIFSLQPAEREQEFKMIEKQRAERVGLLYEEKKRKREALQKAEARKNKAVYDFENNLGGIQYARGVMSKERLGRLRDLIGYCHRTSIEAYQQSLVTVNPAVIELLGDDMFPSLTDSSVDPFGPDATEEIFLQALKLSGVETVIKPPETFRIDLVGNPNLMNLFRKTVALGKGLYGMSNSDVVELLQCYASCLLGAVFRGYSRRWRYQAARRLWRQMDHVMKSKVFLAWKKDVRYCILVRETCLRKFTAWKYMSTRATFRRKLFRICFWPFFVWRRTAVHSGRAREKTKFLVSRLVPTVQQLHVFHAWKKLYIHERGYNRPADAFCKAKRQQKFGWQFGWWRYWTRRRRGLRRAWLRSGYLMMLKKIEESARVPFQLWAAATAFKVRLRHTIKCNGRYFRGFLLPGCEPQLPHHAKRIKLSKENKRRYLAEKDKDAEKDAVNRKTLERQLSAIETRKFNKSRACLKRALTLNDLGKKKEKKAAPDAPPKFLVYKPQEPVNWHPDLNDFDIKEDYDEEEGEEGSVALCDRVRELYANFRMQRHMEFYADHDHGPDYGFEFVKLTKQTKAKIDTIKERFDEVEIDHFLTSGFIYHRSAHHALINLRRYALYHRNARLSKNKYNRKLMKMVLEGFVRWANRGIKETLGGDDNNGKVEVSKAEQMAFECRSERMEKLKRRRAAAQYHKDKDYKLKELERQNDLIEKVNMDEKVDLHSRARMRRFSQAYQRVCPPPVDARRSTKRTKSSLQESPIHENDDGEDGTYVAPNTSSPSRSCDGEQQKVVRRQTSAEIFAKELLTAESALYENVDMLEWDREERDKELELMQQMVQYGSVMNSSAGKAALLSAKEAAKAEAGAKFREGVIAGILEFEGMRTDAALAREFKFVAEFKIKMARNMVDVLCKIHEEVRFSLLCQEKRQFFRRLRLPLLLKRSLAMVNYKKMTNWIRICRRLHAMFNKAAFYRAIKTKWIIFNRWLKSFEKDTLDATPGIISMLKHRTELRNSFSVMLKDRRFLKTCYPRNGRLKRSTHDLPAIFLRWKEYTQDQKMLTLLLSKVDAQHRLRVLQKVFWCLKTNISILHSYEERQKQFSYAYVRVRQDCDQITKRYMSRRRRSLSFALRAYQEKSQLLLKREGLNAPSFKKFIDHTVTDIAERTMLEQILLLEAFESKGELQHKDIRIRSEQPNVDGMRFADPKPFRLSAPPCAVKEGIPAGYTLSKVKVALQSGLGIIGLQCFWGAAGAKPIESRIRGKMFGGGITNGEFIIPPRDFLMDIEYICEGNAMIGIRFKTFFLPWSKWIGSKANPLTKRHLLSANNAKLEPHDAHLQYKSGGTQEDMYPGVPQQYIIGLGGVETAARVTCLCVIVRKVTSQHVFSYSWVESLPEPEPEPEPEDEVEGKTGEESKSPTNSRPSSRGLPPILAAKDEATSREELKNQMLSRFQQGDDVEDDKDVDVHEHAVKEVTLSTAEEQFFDVIRMRSVEVKAAEARALTFARRIWSCMEMRMHKKLSIFTGITIISALSKWFLEGLCKTLVRMPVDRGLANKLSDDIQKNRTDLEYNENAINAQELTVKAKKKLATMQPWFGRSLLSPKMRATKKAYLEELQELIDQLQALKDVREEMLHQKEIYRVQSEVHLPHIQLTIGIMQNLDVKIKASAYKHKLLENMSLENMKAQLGGAREGAYNFKLSDISMERIRDGKARLTKGEDQLARIMAEEDEDGGATAAQERLKQTQQLYGERKSTDIDQDDLASELLNMWRPPSRPGLHAHVDKAFKGEQPDRVMVSDDYTFKPNKKKTYRKSHALNPLGGQPLPRAKSKASIRKKPPSVTQSNAFSITKGAISGTGWQSQSMPVTMPQAFLEDDASQGTRDSDSLPQLSLSKVFSSHA